MVLGAVDLYLMRRHPVKPHPRPQVQTIGLHAEADGETLRIQWNRHSRPIANADRAVLYIADGTERRQVALSGPQLDGSSVRYWPESGRVSLRMEVFRGQQQASDSTDLAFSQKQRPKEGGRSAVERLRPSPFEPIQPEIVVVQYRPPSVILRSREVAEAPQPEEEKSSFDRVLSKIPLLRRLRKHQESGENESPRTPQ